MATLNIPDITVPNAKAAVLLDRAKLELGLDPDATNAQVKAAVEQHIAQMGRNTLREWFRKEKVRTAAEATDTDLGDS